MVELFLPKSVFKKVSQYSKNICAKKRTLFPPSSSPSHSLSHPHPVPSASSTSSTLRRTRHILALRTRLPPGHTHATPLPIRARPTRTQNINLRRPTRHRPRHPLHRQPGNRHARRRRPRRASILIVLFDDDPIARDAAQLDVGVGDAGDRSGGAVDGLDTHPVLRVGDAGVGDGDAGDGVVVAAADAADREAVPAGAGAAGEVDVLVWLS